MKTDGWSAAIVQVRDVRNVPGWGKWNVRTVAVRGKYCYGFEEVEC